MNKFDLGAVSAYAMAKEKGYQGTEEEFAALMAQSGDNALRAEAAADRAEEVLASIPLDFQEVSQDVDALNKQIVDKEDDLSVITNGHFRRFPYTIRTKGNYYKLIDGLPEAQGLRSSSGMMLAPKNLCIGFGKGEAARSYLYFYTKDENGEFKITLEPYAHAADNTILNYISPSSMESRMVTNIPDGTYVEICKYNDSTETVDVFSWDGEPFGMDVCATSSIPVTDEGKGIEAWMSQAGGSGITVHGKARYLIADGAKLRLAYGYKNGEYTLLSGTKKTFFTLPEGYDHFRIRLETADESERLKTFTGDVRDMVYIVASTTEERPISNAVKVIENCERACNLTWTPQMDINERNGEKPSFKTGIEYNGLIYSSQWNRARIVGWHVSPHTFVNATNDVDSIMYKETAVGDGVVGPIYGTVCSAFATMCAGWECPQTNAGFFYDPDIEKYYSHKPQLGQIYTDVRTHCVIPAGVTNIGDIPVVSAYEAIHPVSTKTTRFMSISKKDIWEYWNPAAGLDFYGDYGYVIHNPRANPDMSTVPYADFAGAEITNGSARPYKGDRSVYTSAEEKVLINIKDEAAVELYLESENGSVQKILINGARPIDVKPYLSFGSKKNAYGDRCVIYYVYTDTDDVKESFEYIEATPATYNLSTTSLEFGNDEFWYADCTYAGLHYYQNNTGGYEKRNGSVLANPAGDYSKWFRNGNRITAVNAIFRKGEFGAYTVPIPQNEKT